MAKPGTAANMSGGLPVGWDMDYDGRRWFYTYRPTGQVQYHFPNDGDEFPDFIDAKAPAPQLAPEERLESQQQMRRNTAFDAQQQRRQQQQARMLSVGQGAGMSAQARPVSYIWEGDEGGGGGGASIAEEVFQPENFMYLGPGTYADVSPLIEEEEEAAKRAVAGDGGGGVSRIASEAGSPGLSLKTTPTVPDSEVSPPPVMRATAVPVAEPATAAAPAPAPIPAPAPAPVEVEEEPVIHMLDGREMPSELPAKEMYHPNPVGIIAEMPTQDTAKARVETHPPAVEIGDSSVLAPVEVALAAGQAEERQKEEEPRRSQEKGKEAERMRDTSVPNVTVGNKPTDAQYQPYQPSQAGPSESQAASGRKHSLQRDPSLMMKAASKDATVNPESVPTTLAPQRNDQIVSYGSITEEKKRDAGAASEEARRSLEKQADIMPSVEDVPPNQSAGISKVPSVLKPARGRAPAQLPTPGPAAVSADLVTAAPPALKSYQIPPQDPRVQVTGNIAGQSGYQAPVTQPFPSQHQQPVRPATAFTSQRQSSTPGPRSMGLPQAAPPSALPAHVAAISRPASTPAVVAPLKLGRQVSRKPIPEGPRDHRINSTAPTASQPVYPPSVPESDVSQISDPSEPASTGSGTVSPLLSRSGRSDSFPAQSPSPLDSPPRGRIPSSTSLNHTMSSDTVFTPSPASTTPGSGGQATRRPSSSIRNSISGPIPVHTPNQGPPVPSKVPLEQESYFPPQGSGRMNKSAQSPGPARPPKEPEPKPQTPLSQQTPLGPGPDMSGYALGRIDEGREDAHITRSPNAQISPATLARRHSTASSIQPSRPPTVSSISSLEYMRPFSPDMRVSTLSEVNQSSRASMQVQIPPQGQFPPHQGPFSAHAQLPPHGYYFPQGQNTTSGPMSPQGVDPRQAGLPLPYQPANHQPVNAAHQRQQSWQPQPSPQMMPGSPGNQQGGQGQPGLKDKEKEHKWTKWFKGQKGATLSKPPPGPMISPPISGPLPPQPGLSNPNLGQMPTGGLQGQPAPIVQHARVPSGPLAAPFPQAGPPHNGMTQTQWQPVPGPGGFNAPTGAQPPVAHHQGQPRPGPQQRVNTQPNMNPLPPAPPVPIQSQHPSMQGAIPARNGPPVNPGEALGSHPPLGAGLANTAKPANRASMAGPPAPWGQERRSSAPSTSGHRPAPAHQNDRWAQRPVADYSGGGWGRGDA